MRNEERLLHKGDQRAVKLPLYGRRARQNRQLVGNKNEYMYILDVDALRAPTGRDVFDG